MRCKSGSINYPIAERERRRGRIVAFATGAVINIQQIGAGQVTIQGAAGVTITSTGATATTPKTRAQYSAASIIKTDTDSWTVIGDIA